MSMGKLASNFKDRHSIGIRISEETKSMVTVTSNSFDLADDISESNNMSTSMVSSGYISLDRINQPDKNEKPRKYDLDRMTPVEISLHCDDDQNQALEELKF